MQQEQQQNDLGYLVKMNFGVGELVLVRFVMEHHPCLKGRYLLLLEEVIQQLRKPCTWLSMLVMFIYLYGRINLGLLKQCKIGMSIKYFGNGSFLFCSSWLTCTFRVGISYLLSFDIFSACLSYYNVSLEREKPKVFRNYYGVSLWLLLHASGL